ncbi:MAG TPA: hypothetical protein VN577_19690 [Terriglobales bacterium]|nr:hypothetical protein [Terriglobales bacterium]
MRFTLQNTRLLQPGVLFAAVLLISLPLPANDLQRIATFKVAVPAQNRATDSRASNGLVYLRPGVLALWHTEKRAGELSRRARVQPTDPWWLQLQVISTENGKVLRTVEFPSRREASGIAVQKDGLPVVLTGPLVRCLSPDLQQNGSYLLQNASEPKGTVGINSSPGTGRVFVAESGDTSAVTTVDAATCKALTRVQPPDDVLVLSGTDDVLIGSSGLSLAIFGQDQKWQVLYQHPVCCFAPPVVVSKDKIAVVQLDQENMRSSEHHLLLVSMDGKLLLDDMLERGTAVESIVTNQAGTHAAAVTSKRQLLITSTKVEATSYDLYVRVYRLDAPQRIANLKVTVGGEEFFAMAISPDGSQMALQTGTKLTIYRLR